jgi:drug/metabolite transporter (DMT)-like permease
MKNNKNLFGTILVLMGSMCWGIGGVAGESLLKTGNITTVDIIPLRLVFSGIFLLLYCIFKDRKSTFAVWKLKRDALDVIIYAFFGIGICQFTYYLTIEYSNAGTATILQYMAPVIILTITCIKCKRLPSFAEIICILLAVGGVFIISTHGSLTSLVISPKALIIGLVSAFTVVVYNVQPGRLLKRHSPLVLLAWAMTIAGIVTCVVFRIWVDFPSVSANNISLFMIIVFAGTVFAFAAYMKGVALIGPAKASLYSGLEPMVAVILSSLLLGTKFMFVDIMGFVFIVGAIFILSVSKNTPAVD